MREVLFVEDEPMVLQALQRMLHTMRHEWNMRFAENGTRALQMMAETQADVIVCDMRMPTMNGAQLLNEVMQHYPRTVRLILSGFADQEMIMECVGGAHQFISKPCDSETLRHIVGRALETNRWVDSNHIKSLVARMGPIPTLPTLYFQIMQDLGDPETTLDQVGVTIAQDPGMTGKMLQMVNSAFFGLRRQISDPTEAVLQLGLETIKSLVLGIHVFSEYVPAGDGPFAPDKLWHHSLAVGATARRIAQLERQEKGIVEECFTAGLLHDIGRLVLLAKLPAQYSEVYERSKQDGVTLLDAERAVFGTSHAEVGGYLLGLWGLPAFLVEAAVFHHCPNQCPTKSFSPLTAVHVANAMEQEPAEGQSPSLLAQLDREYLTQLGLWNRAPVWRSTTGGNRFT